MQSSQVTSSSVGSRVPKEEGPTSQRSIFSKINKESHDITTRFIDNHPRSYNVRIATVVVTPKVNVKRRYELRVIRVLMSEKKSLFH